MELVVFSVLKISDPYVEQNILDGTLRSSHPEVFMGKGVLKICSKTFYTNASHGKLIGILNEHIVIFGMGVLV